MSRLEDLFPGLADGVFQLTSPATAEYNCIAWAAGEADRWWWPDAEGGSYWPPGVPREETLPAFAAAFARVGYSLGSDDSVEVCVEKVALYARAGLPTHAARQVPGGRWTSKLGQREDIEHELADLAGDIYGVVAVILRRPGSGA